MNFEIIRRKRKTMSIHVYRDQRVVVRAPLRCKDKEIELFYDKHRNWITKKLQESKQYPGLKESRYINDGSLRLLGETYTISVRKGLPHRVTKKSNQIIVVQGDENDTVKTERMLTKWKRTFAADLYEKQLALWSAKFPQPLRDYQFKIRKMSRQWGNCNHKGIITINSQLIRYPQACVDYVLVHELTHLKHLHHGRTFYGLMEKVMPDWQDNKRLLSEFSEPGP